MAHYKSKTLNPLWRVAAMGLVLPTAVIAQFYLGKAITAPKSHDINPKAHTSVLREQPALPDIAQQVDMSTTAPSEPAPYAEPVEQDTAPTSVSSEQLAMPDIAQQVAMSTAAPSEPAPYAEPLVQDRGREDNATLEAKDATIKLPSPSHQKNIDLTSPKKRELWKAYEEEGSKNYERAAAENPKLISTMEAASERTGVPLPDILAVCNRESYLVTTAKSATTSAKGIKGIINGTFIEFTAKYGDRFRQEIADRDHLGGNILNRVLPFVSMVGGKPKLNQAGYAKAYAKEGEEARRNNMPFNAEPKLAKEILRLRDVSVAAPIFFASQNLAEQMQSLSEQDKMTLGNASYAVLNQWWPKRTRRMSKLLRAKPNATMYDAVQSDTPLETNYIPHNMKVSDYINNTTFYYEATRSGFVKAIAKSKENSPTQAVEQPRRNNYDALKTSMTQKEEPPTAVRHNNVSLSGCAL